MTRLLPPALSRVSPTLARGLSILADLVVPQSCAGCGCRGVSACPACVAQLHGPVILAAVGSLATPRRRGPLPCLAAARYGGQVRTLLVAYKERRRMDLARPLGTALARVIVHARPGPAVVLVPVPSSAAARRRRGFDHVRMLCAVAATVLRGRGYRVQVVPLLRPVRRLADQAGLGVRARAENLAGAFALRAPARAVPWPAAGSARPRVLIIDDVVTTGATVREAARALREGALRPHAAVVVAATPSRRSGAATLVRRAEMATRPGGGLPGLDGPSG
ncbi:ComF family protein [Frankia sp. R82]|uniref:ComF family protein n=1 Tax=Frankia sp. R82 TaxID=2950553 RepID=UPI002043D1EE|nr:ComF family protein [Frankia sp. R82]MCM3885669.1 ComF family protein [Frankia sp. R82]